jgi:predicted ester cyclase
MHLLASAFSDQRWTMHRVVTEGSRMALQCTHSERHTGDFFGLPASGRRFADEMHIVRVENGKAVEHWAVRDCPT